MRSGRAPWLLAALAWVLVVTAVGSVTYLVVDRAGRGIGDTSQTRPLAVEPSSPPAATGISPRPPRTATRTGSPAPSPRSSSTRTPSPAATVPRAAPTPTPTRTTTTVPASRTESFATRGGTVVATCTDGGVRLDSITVRDGWRFETEQEEGHLEVKFESGEDELELTIGCRDGVPVRVDH